MENNIVECDINKNVLNDCYGKSSIYQRKNHFKEWLNQLQARETIEIPQDVIDKIILELKNNNITYIFNDMNTQSNTWGHPGKNATKQQMVMYSSHLSQLSEYEKRSIDLVFIDGRFRVACCLKCYDNISDESLIAFDDFLNRPQYHIVLDYFEIVNKTVDNRMVILKKKKNVTVPEELIQKYELIAS